MTAPRVTRAGVIRVDALAADVFDEGRLAATVIAAQAQGGDLRALDGQRVIVAIERADAPAPGSPLDYLAELKSALLSLTDAHDSQTDDERHRELRRCMSLANTASLSILAERARR